LKEKVSQKPAEDHEIQLTNNNIKILVAEDNAMNQTLMKHLLAGQNFYFDIVNNGKEAIEALQQKKYDVVLMDIQMPQMDGYTAMLKIRNELKINTPVIAMTAHAMAGERKKCLSYGMSEYISKPIHESELFKIINNIIAGHNGETLNLAYLKEISGGDAAFEVTMLEQFLQQVPGELAALQDAFNQENYPELALIAHNMKTSVSFVGLTNKLTHYLDYIENNAGIQERDTLLQETIRLINEICSQAFREAKEYLGQ
jgi:CheY-like chemotaxis protein